MDLEHHPLIHEFPEYLEVMHRLKVSDPEFRALAAEYHELDKAIYRAEQDIEPHDDAHVETLKKKRIFLKDTLLGLIHEALEAPEGPPRA